MIIIAIIITTMMIDMMDESETHWKLFAAISGIYIKSRRIAEESLRPINVTWPQFGALHQLAQRDNITQTELADRLETDTTTVMVLCNSMEKKGWIRRTKDPADKRVNRLILTGEGRRVYSDAYPLMLEGYTSFTQAITEDELATIMPILSELYSKISEIYDKEMMR
jgi:DNA-binding MarR family transcriptional regulator